MASWLTSLTRLSLKSPGRTSPVIESRETPSSCSSTVGAAIRDWTVTVSGLRDTNLAVLVIGRSTWYRLFFQRMPWRRYSMAACGSSRALKLMNIASGERGSRGFS